MSQIITRRGMLGGLISAMAAPAIVRAASLMQVKAIVPVECNWLTWEAQGLLPPSSWRVGWGAAAVLSDLGPEGLVFREVPWHEFYLEN